MRAICSTKVVYVLFFATLLARPGFGGPITFDDIDATAGDVDLSALSPYQGLTWTDISAYTSVPGFPGFNNGIVSTDNGAYSGGEVLGAPVVGSISSSDAFNFIDGYFGAGYYDNLSVTVKGLFNNAVLFTQTISVGTSGSSLFTFNFTNINRLDLFATQVGSTTDPFGCGSFNCTQFTFDNLTVTPGTAPTGIPEPSSLGLVSLSIIAICVSSICKIRRAF